MSSPTVAWCLTDNRPGHRRQIEGLIGELGRRRPVDAHWIPVQTHEPSSWMADIFHGRFDVASEHPDPQLILAAGHSTHLPALAARRARGGRAVVLMRPSLPTPLFDLCLVPEHDLLSPLGRLNRFRVVPTRGVLNPFKPSTEADAARALILIGGPSKHHGWSDDDMLRQLSEIRRLSPCSIAWTLTTSRRTPDSFLQRAEQELTSDDGRPAIHIVPCDQTRPGWLSQQLARAQTVFVSEDSISMIYESLTVGADVALLNVPRLRRRSRNIRCLDLLLTDGLVVSFDDWCIHRFEQRQRIPFHEASRCADIVCDRLLNAA